MAYQLSRFEFEESIPSFNAVKSTFKGFTGLELSIIGHINLTKIDSEIDNVTLTIANDYQKVKECYSEKRMVDELPFEQMVNYKYRKELIEGKHNYIESLSFYHQYFYEIKFERLGNILEILWMANHNYFRIALQKTLYTLNNQSFQKDKDAPNYLKKKFKKLRKWDEYSWYNRPRK